MFANYSFLTKPIIISHLYWDGVLSHWVHTSMFFIAIYFCTWICWMVIWLGGDKSFIFFWWDFGILLFRDYGVSGFCYFGVLLFWCFGVMLFWCLVNASCSITIGIIAAAPEFSAWVYSFFCYTLNHGFATYWAGGGIGLDALLGTIGKTFCC